MLLHSVFVAVVLVLYPFAIFSTHPALSTFNLLMKSFYCVLIFVPSSTGRFKVYFHYAFP